MTKKANRKKNDKRLMLCVSLLCLLGMCASGCGKRNVNYVGDEQESTDISESLNTGESAGQSLWEESFAATRANGDTVTVKVKTAIGSEPDTSPVIGIKRVELDGSAGERIAKAALGEEASLEGDVYTGSRDGIPYQMKIGQKRISLYPTDDAIAQIAPEDLKGALGFYFEEGGGTKGGGNMSELTEEEAVEIAERFLEEIGFSDRTLSGAKTLYWTGKMESLGENAWATMSVQNGYVFYYEQTLRGDTLSPLSGDTDTDGFWLWQEEDETRGIYDSKMHTMVCVYGHDVIAADIYNIYEITSIEDDVSLLPVKTIQGIMQKELAQPDDYYADLYNNSLYYWGLNYRYCLLWDDGFTQGSYVPVCELHGNQDFMNITVNAIDGSIITWEQKEGIKSANSATED